MAKVGDRGRRSILLMAGRMEFLLSIVIVAAALACGASATDGGGRLPAIYVFGDSSADVGNNNYLPNAAMTSKANFSPNGIDFPGGIPTGRFSNGYNGIDYLSMMLGFKQSPPPFLSFKTEAQMLHGANFASGSSGILDSTGTSVITFTTQIKNFQNIAWALFKYKGKEVAHLLLSKSIFFISSGSNDLSAYHLIFGLQNKTKNQLFIDSLLDKLEDHLKALHKLGARKYGIFGVSHIGCIPYWRSRIPTGGCIEELNNISRQFNTATIARLHQLSSTLNGMKYSYVNTYDINSILLAKPHQYGYKDITSACCGSGKFNGASGCTPNATYCPNREDHFFWDPFHTTQVTSKWMVKKAYNGSRRFATPININKLAEC